MAKLDRIAAHPIREVPYDKLVFVKLDRNRVPLYSVTGREEPPSGTLTALGRAFERHGGKCFYCSAKFEPQPFSSRVAHRDHVLAASKGGSDLLHNLVIACTSCGRAKADDPIHDFRPRAAKDYLAALESHISRCVRASDEAD